MKKGNTDKYEGHIQGEWRDTIHEGAKAHHIYAGDVNICTVFPNEATANLVTDAPLLLEEVKRLREENDELHAQRVQISWIQEARGGQSKAFELLAEVKRLREVVDKQQMQYVNLETAYHNSPSQIEIKHEIDTAVEYRTEHIKKYMKEKSKQLHAEVKRLREAIADIAKNMQAADPSYLQGFIRDLLEVIEDVDISN